jgi:tetratricopeptide (TPR) repeat protein
MLFPKEAYPQARAATLKALEIDDKLAEAYASLAGLRHYYDWAWLDAERIYKEAIRLNPNYATVHQWYAELLCCLGRHEEAIREINHASVLDPLSPAINTVQAYVHFASGANAQAIEYFNNAIELHPNFYLNYVQVACTYSQVNMHEEAIKEAQKAETLLQNPMGVALLGYVYAMAGKKDKSLQILDKLMRTPEQKLLRIPVSLAVLYISLRDYNQAFYWFDIAFEQRNHWLNYAKVDPRFDPVRSDLRFVEMLTKMGLNQ